MAAQSQLIRNRDTQKSCFSGSFLLKIASHGQTVHFRLYSVIHHRKALVISFHMVFFKNFNVDPARRQIFGNASAEKCIPVLRVCHTYIQGVAGFWRPTRLFWENIKT